MNSQLTTELMQEVYEVAVSCELGERNNAYMASFDLLCKLDDVGGVAHAVRKLIDMLRAEHAEHQQLRCSYLALRGEIEDVQSQLFEAENLAKEGLCFSSPEDLAHAIAAVRCFDELSAELIAEEMFKGGAA